MSQPEPLPCRSEATEDGPRSRQNRAGDASKTRRQGRYWILTISCDSNPWTPTALLPGQSYLVGQQELGAGGFKHWQVMVAYSKKIGIRGVQRDFGPCFAELTFSDNARGYCCKEETRVAGTQFEFGTLATRRNEEVDWEIIRDAAQLSDLSGIPADIYVRCYNQLRRIGQDHLRPLGMERTCHVFWGRTGTGKSRRAWEEAGMGAYPKDPNTKFWDGYRNHEHVVIDEFRGIINISNLLRWLDRYPVIVEVKGSSVVFCARTIWITSNLNPEQWYPDADVETKDALLRRLTVVSFE